MSIQIKINGKFVSVLPSKALAFCKQLLSCGIPGVNGYDAKIKVINHEYLKGIDYETLYKSLNTFN